MIEIKDSKVPQIKRECNKCVYSTRDGNCIKWMCDGTKTVKDIKSEAVEEFANWLVNYKVVPDGAMKELIRDFNGEMSKR